MKDPLIDKLEAEIRYLKKLLDENGIQYDYQAYVDGALVQCGEVQFPELTPEHAIQFYSYFRGRKDVAGIRVITHLHCHTRFAIIDQSIVWYGSMNLLSNPKDDDNLMRIVSPEIAQELLELGCVGKE